ncbi:MAG: hypothetical protein JSU65_06290 [Candidatus Zixiibacteriota bacterium]|nr:MAG: hypothetical protein JSU65_06290 [candidate division Zixibacteria bacterium]
MNRLHGSLLLSMLLVLGLSGSLSAKSSLENSTAGNRVDVVSGEVDERVGPSTRLKALRFDDRSVYNQVATGSPGGPAGDFDVPLGVAGSSISPGLSVMESYDDWQYTYKGVRIEAGFGDPNMQFAYSRKLSTGEEQQYGFNIYDPTGGGDWPRGIGIGCYVQPGDMKAFWPNMSVYPDGRVILAGYDDAAGPMDNHQYANIAVAGCFFGGGSQIPPSQYRTSFVNPTGYLLHPVVEVQIVGADTITHVVAGEEDYAILDPGAPDVKEFVIQYYRLINGTMTGATWIGPTTVDTASTRAHICASQVSDDVAIIYSDATFWAYDHNNPGDQDVFYRKSSDGGVTWGPRVNITNYDRTMPSHAPWVETYGIYDSEGYLHVLWSGQPWPANVYDLPDFWFDDFSVSLFHWSDRTSAISRVANREYGPEWAQQVCGMGGYNTLYLAFFSVSECNGRLYVIYAGWNDVFDTGTIDDCASSPGTAADKRFQANGDLYLHVSSSLDGLLWDRARNITQSYMPGCDSAGYGGVCMNDTKPALAPYGMDSAAYGQELTWPGDALLVVDPPYSGSHYLNLFYVEDHFPGQAAISHATEGSSGSDWTLNPLRWMRVPCIDPVEAPDIFISPTGVGYPQYVQHGKADTITVEIRNDGNVTLNVSSITAVESTGPSGWLGVSDDSKSVLSGQHNTATFDLWINHNAVVNDPGTVVVLDGEVYLLSDAPAPRDSVSFKIENFLVADTVVGLEFDTVSTNIINLVVSSNGAMGGNGSGRVNLDYAELGGDCDTTAEIYLYSGSPYIMQDLGGGEYGLSYSMHQADFVSEVAFKPVDGYATPTKITGPNYDGFFTGTFVNWDSTIALEKTIYAPTGGGDSSDFMIQHLRIFSFDGGSHSNLVVGELMDWDLPAEVDVNNDSHVSGAGNGFVYFQGTDTSYSGCQLNADRLAAQAFLGWFTNHDFNSDPCANDEDFYGAYAAYNDSDIFPAGGLVAADLWSKTEIHTGLTSTGEAAADIHGVMTFLHDFSIAPTDTFNFYTVLTTVQDGSIEDLETNIEAASAWCDEHLHCLGPPGVCGNIDDDGSGLVDAGDLTRLVDYLYITHLPIVNPWTADMDGVAGITNNDMITLVDHLFYSFQPLSCDIVSTSFPVSDDILEFRFTEVPAGVTGWSVEVWLEATSPWHGISLPFDFYCPTSSLNLDAINLELTGAQASGLIDNGLSKGLIVYSLHAGSYPSGPVHLATLDFSIDFSVETQTIVIDTGSYVPSHTTVLSRIVGGPRAEGVIPQLGTIEEACYATGDISGDSIFDVADVVRLIDALYKYGESPAEPWQGDVNGDYCLDTLDIAAMNCYLFGTCPDPPDLPVLTGCDVIACPLVSALGEATVDRSEGGIITVSNVGSSGDDGVRVELDGPATKGVQFKLGGVDLSQDGAGISFGASVLVQPKGSMSGFRAPYIEQVALAACANVGGILQIISDFEPLGDPNVSIHVFIDTLKTGEANVPGGGLIGFGYDAGAGLPACTAVALHGSDPPAFVLKFDRIVQFEFFAGQYVNGDKLLLVAENADVVIEDVIDFKVTSMVTTVVGVFTLFETLRDACCLGFTGNADDDALDIIDIGDLTRIIDYLFISYTEPACMYEANVDGEGIVDIGDVTHLIAFLFIQGDIPVRCP